MCWVKLVGERHSCSITSNLYLQGSSRPQLRWQNLRTMAAPDCPMTLPCWYHHQCWLFITFYTKQNKQSLQLEIILYSKDCHPILIRRMRANVLLSNRQLPFQWNAVLPRQLARIAIWSMRLLTNANENTSTKEFSDISNTPGNLQLLSLEPVLYVLWRHSIRL